MTYCVYVDLTIGKMHRSFYVENDDQCRHAENMRFRNEFHEDLVKKHGLEC
jgi:hypothetical protein